MTRNVQEHAPGTCINDTADRTNVVIQRQGRRRRVTFAALTGKKTRLILTKILPAAIDPEVYGEGPDYDRLLTPEIRERLKEQFIIHTENYRNEGVVPTTEVSVYKVRRKNAS